MRKFLFIFCFLPVITLAQHKYFIRFSDKANSPYTVDSPSAFLSERAVERRQLRYIPVQEQDFPVNQNYVDSLVSRGATILTRSKWFNGVSIECDSSVLASVLSLPFVVSSKQIFFPAIPSVPSKPIADVFPPNSNSPLRISNSDYGSSYNQIHLMNGEFLHENGFKGNGMLIAMIDDGFYSVDQLPAFESLRNQDHIVATWDFVDGNSSVYEDDTHGMNTLSTIAGDLTGELLGTAPNASFLLLRSEDYWSENIIEEYNWDAAAEFADSAGADVISSSLGYTTFDDTLANHSYSDMDGNHCPSTIAADIAASKGMLVLVSAGNQGYSPWHYLSAPSDGDSVLCVGAVDSIGQHALFSSWGPSADGDVKPNVDAQGVLCTLADASGGITQGNGTSFSCPVLAGAATCLWQSFPTRSAMQIKEAIEHSANYYFSPTDAMGYGIPDFRLASYFLSSGESSLPSNDFVLEVFPNPFSESLNVRFFSTTLQTVKLELVNSLGQIVISRDETALSWTINNFSISNSNLTSGIYFLRLSTAEDNYITRIIKY